MYKKLLISNLLLILVIVCILFFGTTNLVRNIVAAENENLRQTVVDVGFSQLSKYFQNMQSILLEGCVDDTLQEVLQDFSSRPDKMTDPAVCSSLQNALRKLVRGTDCIRAEVLPIVDGELYRYDSSAMAYIAAPDQARQAVVSKSADGGYAWVIETTAGEQYLRAAHLIYDMRDWSTPLGVIVVDANSNLLLPYLRSIAVDTTDSVFLLDADNNQLLPTSNYFSLPESLCQTSSPAAWTDENLNYYFVEIIPECGWKLVGVLGQSSLLRSWENAQRSLALLTLTALVSVAFLINFLTRSATRPIMKLADHMRQTQDKPGLFSPLQPDGHVSKEILVLYNSFNEMQKRQNSLVEEIYVARIEEQKAQMRALMAQINPHFLYNTLDSINWMAMKYRAQDIQRMVSSLATMLRHSLNKGNDYISLKNELDQVRSYIQIQQMRFRDWFQIEFDVSPDLLDVTVIKLILQPLVENAITHGFERGQKALLRIEAKRQGDDLVIRVCNNGHPIDLQKVYRVMNGQEESENGSGYGLRNVNTRLIRHYGDQYGITFASEDGWTVASIKIPMEKEERL